MANINLTGIKPTGIPHIANYFGALKPFIDLANNSDNSMIFIADYHALNTIKDASKLKELTFEVACILLACGLDTNKTIIYKQSDVPQVFELQWILNNVTPKGLLNRAHAYKSVLDTNRQNGADDDFGVNMGLFNYPVLMAADILLMDATKVPVGVDQKQHVEITKEIVRVFNNTYGQTLTMPECSIIDDVGLIPGLDGRKMSKSYGNIIELICPENELKKKINRIITNSQLPGEAKDINCALFNFYKLFASKEELQNMKKLFQQGIGWGEAKKMTFEVANKYLTPIREKYNYYKNNKKLVLEILDNGAQKARIIANKTLNKVHKAIGKL